MRAPAPAFLLLIIVALAGVLIDTWLLLPRSAGVPGTASQVSAWIPFTEHDLGATVICVSDAPGRPLPPFILTGK